MLRDEVNSFLEQLGLSALADDQSLAFKLNIGSKAGHSISCKYSEQLDELHWCYSCPIAPYEQERVINLINGNSMWQQQAMYGFNFSVFWRDDNLVVVSTQPSNSNAQMLMGRFNGLIELIKNKFAPNESSY